MSYRRLVTLSLALLVTATPTRSAAEEGAAVAPPEALRSCRMVFAGVFPNGGEGRVIDPAFAGSDIARLESQMAEILRAVPGWSFLDRAETFHGDEASEGNVVFVALVVSRAEITHTAFNALGIHRHTAWLTWSLEFFNVQTRTIYYSVMRTGYRSLQTPASELTPEERTTLMYRALSATVPEAIQTASQEFDPDFVTGTVGPVGESYTLHLRRSSSIGPGQNFHVLDRGCTRADAPVIPCVLRVSAIGDGVATVTAPKDTKVEAGARVFTILNRKDPPGVRTFIVQKFVADEKAGDLREDGPFLMIQLHARLAASGTLRMVPPIDVVWDRRALDRFREMAIVSTSDVEVRMERVRPRYGISATIANVQRKPTRANDIEAEESFGVLSAAKVFELVWSQDLEPTVTDRKEVSGVLTGTGLALSRVLPGKEVEARDLFLVAAQDSVADLASTVLAWAGTLAGGIP